MSDLRAKLTGLPFAKMTGSGNDFVFFDGRAVELSLVTEPEAIRAICNRHNGIGADGIVVLEALAQPASQASTGDQSERGATARIHYFNSDGTPADLCGNATLCSTTMSIEMGMTHGRDVTLMTPAGQIDGRRVGDESEIDLQPVREVREDVEIALAAGERRVGFAVAGIPHLVVLCEDAEAVDVAGRGPSLRRHPALGAAGANVNWVSRLADGRWRYRTFERGVEGETLACGTGAVAAAVVLCAWGLAESPVVIQTSSGRNLTVSLRRDGDAWVPRLRGEGRVVFRGQIGLL